MFHRLPAYYLYSLVRRGFKKKEVDLRYLIARPEAWNVPMDVEQRGRGGGRKRKRNADIQFEMLLK